MEANRRLQAESTRSKAGDAPAAGEEEESGSSAIDEARQWLSVAREQNRRCQALGAQDVIQRRVQKPAQ
jgi:hypothetical protein